MTDRITMFGIPNCDTIKRARSWLTDRGIDYGFHDYKKTGIEEKRLREWVSELGWETLLNRAGTTFRALPEADKQRVDADKAIKLMLTNPSMIKRPVLDIGTRRIVGFKPEIYESALS